MTTRADVCTAARTWLRVPYHHQGRTRAGCDCGGLVGAVAVQCGIVPASWWAQVFDPAFGGYARQPSLGTLQRVCESFMAPVGEPLPGDVLLMRFATEPQHLAIVADYRHGGLSIIHALRDAGCVTEHRLAPQWRQRIVQAYTMPGVH
jgi:cell wall-associated NlpC family hydrolase